MLLTSEKENKAKSNRSTLFTGMAYDIKIKREHEEVMFDKNKGYKYSCETTFTYILIARYFLQELSLLLKLVCIHEWHSAFM